MMRITIIFLLLLTKDSKTCELTEIQVTKIKQSFSEAEVYLQKEALDEDAAIVIGPGRAGKSTLINYLIGNKLKGVRPSPYSEFKIIKADNQSKGPEIGAGPVSKTTIPIKWKSPKLQNLSIFDCPGFEDNRGPVQDITNSIYIYQLVKKVKSLKFIIVFNYADIERDNIGSLSSFLLDLETFFGNKFTNLFSSMSIIFSKTPYTKFERTLDIEMIKFLLSQKILFGNVNLSDNAKIFLQYVIKNNNSIALFRNAKDDKIFTSDNDSQIFSAINSSKRIKRRFLNNIRPSISDSSLFCLHNSRQNLVSIEEIFDFQQSLLIIFNERLSLWYNNTIKGNKTTIKMIQNKLTKIEVSLNDSIVNGSDVYQSIETIRKIDNKLDEKINASNFLKQVEMYNFISYLFESKESEILNKSVKETLVFLQSLLKRSISKISLSVRKLSEGEQADNKTEKEETSGFIKAWNKFRKSLQSLVNRTSKNEYMTQNAVGPGMLRLRPY